MKTTKVLLLICTALLLTSCLGGIPFFEEYQIRKVVDQFERGMDTKNTNVLEPVMHSQVRYRIVTGEEVDFDTKADFFYRLQAWWSQHLSYELSGHKTTIIGDSAFVDVQVEVTTSSDSGFWNMQIVLVKTNSNGWVIQQLLEEVE